MQAVILAGGEGRRLRPLTANTPKSMLLVAGKPFLEYEINLLKRASVDDLVICIGYGGKAIMDHFGNGQSHGVRIRYSDDGDRLLGTAGSLKKASGLLSERFFITFGDAYPILDFRTAWKHFLLTHKLALMMVYRNCNRYGRSNAVIRDGMVSFYSKKEDAPGMEYIEFGVTFMSKKVLEMIPDDRPVDLEVLYRQLISKKQMAALEVKQRTYDIGSPQGLAEFRELVNSGQIQF